MPDCLKIISNGLLLMRSYSELIRRAKAKMLTNLLVTLGMVLGSNGEPRRDLIRTPARSGRGLVSAGSASLRFVSIKATRGDADGFNRAPSLIVSRYLTTMSWCVSSSSLFGVRHPAPPPEIDDQTFDFPND